MIVIERKRKKALSCNVICNADVSRFSFPLPPIGAPHTSCPECSSSITIRMTKARLSSDYHRSAECRCRGLSWFLLCSAVGRAEELIIVASRRDGKKKINDFPKLLLKHASHGSTDSRTQKGKTRRSVFGVLRQKRRDSAEGWRSDGSDAKYLFDR